MMNKLDKWHKTKLGWFSFALIELGIAYWFISLAIDRGNLLWYALALIFLYGSLHNLFQLIGSIIHGKQARKA